MSLKTDITLFEKIKVLANIVLKKKSYVAVPIQNDMFTRVPDKYRFIRKDQLKLEKMSTQFCLEVFKLDRLINKQFTDLSLPILVLLASEDRVVDNSKIQNKFFAKLKTSHKKLEIFDCMHDIFFEPLHEHVIEKIAEWTAL
jgi:alpha-beta hydrolase superfamily lysophospholipase